MDESLNVDVLLDQWREEAKELESKSEEIEEQQDGYYKGSWDAARERAEPKLMREVIRECISDVENSSNLEELIESMSEWREKADKFDKRILDSNEWFRKSTKRRQLESCIEDLEDVIPDEEFRECGLCGSEKKPISDKRHSIGFRWECPDCES